MRLPWPELEVPRPTTLVLLSPCSPIVASSCVFVLAPVVLVTIWTLFHAVAYLPADAAASVIWWRPLHKVPGIEEVSKERGIRGRRPANGCSEVRPSFDQGLHDVCAHALCHSTAKVMIQVKRIFNGYELGRPHLLESSQRSLLSDADNMLLEVELFGVETEEAKPQLSDSLVVETELTPHRLQVINVVIKPCIPAFHHDLWLLLPFWVQLLEDRDYGRFALLEIIQR